MATLFAQTIIQFAPLRAFARVSQTREYSHIIRELFPKALFHERDVSSALLFEIAWSFLSQSDKTHWAMNGYHHRIGGLPAIIRSNDAQWWHLGKGCHRTDRDPRTGLTLPAIIETKGYFWYHNGDLCHTDRDPRTGLTLPAVINVLGFRWYRGGRLYRCDKDASGNDLPDTIDIGFEDYDFNA